MWYKLAYDQNVRTEALKLVILSLEHVELSPPRQKPKAREKPLAMHDAYLFSFHQ